MTIQKLLPLHQQRTTSVFFLVCFLFLPFFVGAEDSPTNIPKDTLETILKKKELRVGVSLFTPWTLKNKQGELIGLK